LILEGKQVIFIKPKDEVAHSLSILHIVQYGSRAYPAYLMGSGSSFPGVKQLGCEVDHSPPSGGEVKNNTAIPPLLHVFSS
jgi:hypothetical protein